MQILSHAHREKLMLEWQKNHFWGPHTEMGSVRDCVGQRLGVLGYGAIGRQGELLGEGYGGCEA
jgi:phosphoglycerate dehydrogenase-like enzyme